MSVSSLYDTGVRPAIDDFLLKEAEKIRDYGDYWSASSAGYCMRKNIFDRLGLPPVEEDARKQRVFSSGHIFHEWIQNITKKAGLSIAQEVELIDEDLKIKGHFDDLVLVEALKEGEEMEMAIKKARQTGATPFKQHLILYDYKTAHSKWFEYVKDRPISHYNKMQLGTYMYMIRNINEPGNFKGWTTADVDSRNLTEARILKISKDDLRLHEIQLMWSEGLEKEVVEYWRTLNGYWKAKQFPECTCAKYEINKKTGKGFMADPKYNPYYYEGEPCSLAWFAKHGTDDWS